MAKLVPLTHVSRSILVLRGQRVLLSGDLATLYGVEHRALVQAVRRNPSRFPPDFVFQLTKDEVQSLRSQTVISNAGRGGTRYAPLAFTEQGIAMLSSVLHSRRAIAVNVEIMRTFVQLRQWLLGNRELSKRLAELEKRYDSQFRVVFEAIEELLAPPRTPPRRLIGFR